MSTLILRPNGTVYFGGGKVPGGVEAWECIDEEVCDNDSTYLWWALTGQYLLFSYPNHTIEIGNIISITYHIVAKKTGYAGKEVSPNPQYLYIGFADYYAATYKIHTITEEYAEYTTDDIEVNPTTGEPWSWDDVDALSEQIYGSPLVHGIYANEIRITQAWFSIEYEETSVTTEAAAVPEPVANPAYCEFADGNGTIISDTNATERGFEVKHEYSGDLYGAIMHEMAGFEGDTELIIDDDGIRWEGTMIKIEKETGDFVEGAYTLELGAFPAFFYDQLFAGESYTYRAYAIIDDVTYYGEWVAFSLGTYEGEDAIPTDDISEGNPTVPIIPIDIEEIEPYPPFEWEEEPEIPYPPWEWDIPPWEYPDYPPYSWVGDFYYRKPYTKKDLDELREKCIIYNKNSVEFALVLRHNMNVLREFFNMMTDYMDKEEFNDFTDLIPPQRLKELYLDPLEPIDFRDMINEFIRNTADNNIAVNRNFSLIQEGLTDYETGSDDAYFKEITSSMKTLEQDDPDVERMKTIIDNLNNEVSTNFSDIMYNLEIIRAKLL